MAFLKHNRTKQQKQLNIDAVDNKLHLSCFKSICEFNTFDPYVQNMFKKLTTQKHQGISCLINS